VALARGVWGKGDEDAFVEEAAGTVLVGAEFGASPGPLEFAFVVVLFGEGEEEAFFPLCQLASAVHSKDPERGMERKMRREEAYPFLFCSVIIACSI
jgi:hypothetical protein